MQNKLSKSNKLYSVEFVRFIFSVVIIYFHMMRGYISNYAGGIPLYEKLKAGAAYAGAPVECFFIISGYFLFKSFQRKPNMQVKEFAYNKFARLWPVMASFLVIGLVFYNFDKADCFYHSLFLQAAGVTTHVTGIPWYVSPLFWTMIFFFALYKNVKDKNKFNLALGIMVYFSYVIVINESSEIFNRDNVFGVFSLSVLRAVAGCGLGYLIAACEESIRNLDYIKNFNPNKFIRVLIFAAVSVVEIITFYLMIRHFINAEKTVKQVFYLVLIFVIFFVCLISRKGIFTLLFNNKLFGFFGKYSYSIYMMQLIAFYILQKFFWRDNPYVHDHFMRTLIISIAFSVLFGVITYYVIEKPSYMLLNKFGKKLFAEKKE